MQSTFQVHFSVELSVTEMARTATLPLHTFLSRWKMKVGFRYTSLARKLCVGQDMANFSVQQFVRQHLTLWPDSSPAAGSSHKIYTLICSNHYKTKCLSFFFFQKGGFSLHFALSFKFRNYKYTFSLDSFFTAVLQ